MLRLLVKPFLADVGSFGTFEASPVFNSLLLLLLLLLVAPGGIVNLIVSKTALLVNPRVELGCGLPWKACLAIAVILAPGANMSVNSCPRGDLSLGVIFPLLLDFLAELSLEEPPELIFGCECASIG